jgi:hypothetical protein
VFAGASLRKQGVERIMPDINHLVPRHLPVQLDAVFQAGQLPPPVPDLEAPLARMFEE